MIKPSPMAIKAFMHKLGIKSMHPVAQTPREQWSYLCGFFRGSTGKDDGWYVASYAETMLWEIGVDDGKKSVEINVRFFDIPAC